MLVEEFLFWIFFIFQFSGTHHHETSGFKSSSPLPIECSCRQPPKCVPLSQQGYRDWQLRGNSELQNEK